MLSAYNTKHNYSQAMKSLRVSWGFYANDLTGVDGLKIAVSLTDTETSRLRCVVRRRSRNLIFDDLSYAAEISEHKI